MTWAIIKPFPSLKEVRIAGYDTLWKDKAKCKRFLDKISSSESIDDIVIMNVKSPEMLSISLFSNTTLCNLTLYCDIGAAGYEALAKLLRNPACKLEWNQVMNDLSRIVYNKRSIIESYDSNHILESICYPHKEWKFKRDMSTCKTIARMLPHDLTMNWEADKTKVAQKKILIAHYFHKRFIKANRKRNSEYKTLIETIVWASNNMETPEQLPNMMAWVGRDSDGLSVMYDLMKKMPTLCESSSSSSAQRCKRKLSALEIECEAFKNGELGSFSP